VRATRFRDGVPRRWQSFLGLNASVASFVRCGRQGSNLRRPAFQAGALPAELRPRASGASPSIHLPSRGDRRSGAWASVLCRVRPVDGAVFHATRSPFDPGSSTSGCASATGRRPKWRGSGARPSVRSGKLRVKYKFISPCIFSRERVEPFSLERGLDSISFFFKLGITSFSFDIVRLRNDEGDPLGRPREAALRQRSSASASPRGPCRTPT
jgi:hypothetical protein